MIMFRRAVIAWILMIPAAIGNGIFREIGVKPLVGELPAHQISVVTGSALFLSIAYYLLRDHAGDGDDRTLLGIGASWLAGTILFEFGFGHFLDGKSFSELTHDYNIAEGRLWPIVLLVLFFAPVIVKRLVNHSQSSDRTNQHRLHGSRA
jgi:hypothetical protein